MGKYEGLFSCCKSLIYLPDISKWNTNKVKMMTYIFCDWSSFKSLLDISKWNTSNIIYKICLIIVHH